MGARSGIQRVFIALLCVGMAVTGLHCGGSSGTPGVSPGGQTFTIGLIAYLTGEVQDVGQEILVSAQLAVDRANREHPDLHFQLKPRDDEGNALATSKAAAELSATPDILALVAAGSSAAAKMQIAAVKGKNIPVVTPTATASDLLDGGADYVFRVIPPNRAQGDALGRYAAQKLNARKAAVIFQQDDYSKDLRDNFEQAFKGQGGEVLRSLGFESDESDFRVLLNEIKTSGADVILCAGQTVPVARVLLRVRELGLTQPVLSGETAFTGKLLSAAGAAADGLCVAGSSFDLEKPGPALAEFLAAFQKKNGKTPGIYGCYTYDAVALIAEVATAKQVKNGGELIRALHGVNGHPGLTGDIAFDAKGDVSRPYQMYRVSNGAFAALK